MRAKPVALGGSLAALSVLFLYLGSILPTGQIVLLAAASFCVGIAVAKLRVSYALVLYAAVSILALLLIPDKLVSVLYAVCLGNYPIVKLYIEKLEKLPLEWVCKIGAYVVYAAAVYGIYELLLGGLPELQYALWVVFAAGAAVFVIYDLAFSLFMTEIRHRLPKLFQGIRHQ